MARPTGVGRQQGPRKHATWTEVHIGRVANGRLTEHWGVIDQLSMLVQLGVIQSPARVPVAV